MTTLTTRSIDKQKRRSLASLVHDYAADAARWQPLARFHPGGRWWTRLHTDPHHDVWLLTWLTSQATALHDHGESAAAFTVVAGRLVEVTARRDGRLVEVTARRDGRLRLATLPQGHTSVVPPGGVHDVSNFAPEPAVSIHAYSPPLTRMTYYRRHRGGLQALDTVATDEPERNERP